MTTDVDMTALNQLEWCGRVDLVETAAALSFSTLSTIVYDWSSKNIIPLSCRRKKNSHSYISLALIGHKLNRYLVIITDFRHSIHTSHRLCSLSISSQLPNKYSRQLLPYLVSSLLMLQLREFQTLLDTASTNPTHQTHSADADSPSAPLSAATSSESAAHAANTTRCNPGLSQTRTETGAPVSSASPTVFASLRDTAPCRARRAMGRPATCRWRCRTLKARSLERWSLARVGWHGRWSKTRICTLS